MSNLKSFSQLGLLLAFSAVHSRHLGEPLSFRAVQDTDPEDGPYTEGDIIGGIPTDFIGRSGIVNEQYRWPGGVLVYHIHSVFTPTEVKHIHEAQAQITRATNSCITFRKRNQRDRAYVLITKGSGCYAEIGYRKNNVSRMSLGEGCFWSTSPWGVAAHEHIHALGFWHEHSRRDRDMYVKIHWENILSEHGHNFKIANESTVFGLPYDYSSIMHYRRNAFAKAPGLETITPLDTNAIIGQRSYISTFDAAKLRRMYKC